jgi:hypothetical protein
MPFRKHLTTDVGVNKSLENWARGTQLIRTEHFFWITGGHLQKSHGGLLRHLLHSALLSMQPSNGNDALELAKYVCGLRWFSSQRHRPWGHEELYKMLARLIEHSDAKFFFLVDALDECEPQDRLGELVAGLSSTSQSSKVKLCISCRPWSPFVLQFQHAIILHLDQMTYHDMKLYVERRLANVGVESETRSEFQIKTRTRRASHLIETIVRNAEGVFLWTELVVQALCSELRKGRQFEDLERTLTEFPVGLDEYFQHLIIDRVPRTRRNGSDTAAALMLALTIAQGHGSTTLPRPHSFLNFWLLKSGRLAPGFPSTGHENEWFDPKGTERMLRQTKDFLEETCKELLVVVDR